MFVKYVNAQPLEEPNYMFLLFQHGWSALMFASRYGKTEIVKYLIEAEASLDLQTQVN